MQIGTWLNLLFGLDCANEDSTVSYMLTIHPLKRRLKGNTVDVRTGSNGELATTSFYGGKRTYYTCKDMWKQREQFSRQFSDRTHIPSNNSKFDHWLFSDACAILETALWGLGKDDPESQLLLHPILGRK